jgi:hypothetical protein
MSAPRLHPAGPSRGRGGRSTNSRVFQLSAFALTFILVALLVVTSSRAAFVAQNDNLANQVTAATVDLTDEDAGSAMFSSTGLMPGTNLTRCIEVTYSGTVDPVPVKLYAAGTPTGTLAPYLDLTVDVAAANDDAFGSCTNFGAVGGSAPVYTGTLGAFATSYPDYANGASTTWDPALTGEARTFRFTISVQDTTAAEGQTTTFGFSWETRTS